MNSVAQTAYQPNIEQHVGRTINDVEKDLITATLTKCGGNQTWAADILGISISELTLKLRKYAKNKTM